MSESKLPAGMREKYTKNVVLVYGIDVRELDREDLLAVVGLAMSQNARLRAEHKQEAEMSEFMDRYRARACI